LKPEDRLLLTCLRQNFTEAHIQAVSELARSMTIDWERIALTAEQHGVSGLINRNLNLCQSFGLEIPEKAAQKLKLSVYKNALIKERQKERLIRALSFFHDRELEVMLIKGAALDLSVYENPDYVLSNDIDIMIHARREDYSKDFYKEVETFLHKQGIEFQFFSHHDLDINGLLPIDYESIWEQARRAEFDGFPILLLSPTDSLISLCINSSRKRYFRLKSLCDIHETIQIWRDISWQQLGNRSHEFQCENIVFTALLVTSLTTGCNLPLNWEENFDIHPIKRKVIRTAINYLIDRLSFYPYPFSGRSIAGRTIDFSLVLPYLGYKQHQIIRKISYTARGHDF
jgi:hypothetical protein